MAKVRTEHEVTDVIRRFGADFVAQCKPNAYQVRVLDALQQCRTQTLGGHRDTCDSCGHERFSYNSCGNRHCPKCQKANQQIWAEDRMRDALKVRYFHIVFTVPDTLHKICQLDSKAFYSAMFACTWDTLRTFGYTTYGVETGAICLLHTWGKQLSLHPHLHCIVPGGGVNKEGKWQNSRMDGKFLFPVKALSKVFKAKYCEKLKAKEPIKYEQIRQELWRKPWVVFAKKPFGSPKTVVEYLGRYTHKIAISNHRIKNIDNQNVTFDYKDYRVAGAKKQMTLTHGEFIRRFSLHILPKRFVKIRHYGFLSSTWKRQKLKLLQEKLRVKVLEKVEKKPFLPK